jgi:rod shape determining protein RodA
MAMTTRAASRSGAGRGTRRAIDIVNRDPTRPSRHVDWVLVALVLGMAVFGLFAIYSAKRTALISEGRSEYEFVARQIVGIVLGLVGAVIISIVDYRKWRDLAWLFFASTTALLCAVLVLGRKIKGARAWFDFGVFQLQPAELAKVTLVLALATYIGAKATLPFNRFVTTLVITGIPAGLTLIQPDLGTSMVLVAAAMGVLLVGGADVRHILVVTVLAVVSVVAILGTDGLQQYQVDRLTAFTDPDADSNAAVHQRNSQIAIGNGGIRGQGYLEGSQTNLQFVPEQQNDFIFTAISEQFGFAGGAALLGVYALIALRMWRIAVMASDQVGTLVCIGALSVMIFQVFQNIGMTLGIMPITGIPLPLVSYGPSALVGFLALVGLVQSVHMHRFA